MAELVTVTHNNTINPFTANFNSIIGVKKNRLCMNKVEESNLNTHKCI